MPHQGSIFIIDREQLYLTNYQFIIALDNTEGTILAYYMPRALEYQIPSLGDQLKITGDPATYVVTRFSPTPPNGHTPDGKTQTTIYVLPFELAPRQNPNFDYVDLAFDNIY